LRTIDKTAQTTAAAFAFRVGTAVCTAVCTDGCAGGTCGKKHVRTFNPAAILAEMAPAVANLYLNATTGTAAATGGGGAEQRVRWHCVPRHCTDAELRAENPRLKMLMNANHQLCSLYVDTIHQNDGTHLDGGIGIAEDAKWQRLAPAGLPGVHPLESPCDLPLP